MTQDATKRAEEISSHDHGNCNLCDWLEQRLREVEAQVDVGHQLIGSFFEALKPLNLTHINVSNPGHHVTDLIQRLREVEGAVKSRDAEIMRLRREHDNYVLAEGYRVEAAAARQEVLSMVAQTDQAEIARLRTEIEQRDESFDKQWGRLTEKARREEMERLEKIVMVERRCWWEGTAGRDACDRILVALGPPASEPEGTGGEK